MSEERFDRIEKKVDHLQDDVYEMRSDLKVHMHRMDEKMDRFEDHIVGDNKIINHIQPLLERLPLLTEMVEDHNYKKIYKKKASEKIKYWSTRLGLVSIVVGIIFGALRLV